MNKNELVNQVSQHAGLTKTEAGRVVDAVFGEISVALKKKQEVRLVGFGTFCVAKRAATEGRNPRTGQKIKIPACNVAKFRPGKSLKQAVAA